MKKVRELLKNKRWKWTLGGVGCLLVAAILLGLTTGVGVQAEPLNVTYKGNQITISEDNGVYLISTVEQLDWLRNATETETTGKTFRLTGDLSISIDSAATGTFAGIFDGGGHVLTITSLQLANSTEGETAQTDGALFGTVSGTVKNLIVDVKDSAAKYTRTTKTGVEQDGDAQYNYTEIVPVTDGKVSGFDEDQTKVQEIFGASQLLDGKETGTDGKEYVKQTVTETGKETKNYKAKETGTDSFGIICGELTSTGTLKELLVDGEAVTVERNVTNAQGWSKSEQAGTKDVTYYYEIGSDTKTSTLTASDATMSVNATAYTGDTAKSGGSAALGELLKITVSAPEQVILESGKKKCAIAYTVTVENLSSQDLSNVTIAASVMGQWEGSSRNTKVYTINGLPKGDEQELSFVRTYTLAGNISDTVTTDFSAKATVTLAAGEWSLVTGNASVTTTVYDTSVETYNGSGTDLQLTVSAPKAVEVANGNCSFTGTITVKNNTNGALSNVKITLPDSSWTLEGGEIASLGATNSENLSFTYNGPGTFDTSNLKTVSVSYGSNPETEADKVEVSVAPYTKSSAQKSESATNETLSENKKIELTVTAPQAVAKGNDVVYQVQIENLTGKALSSIQLTSTKTGTWSETFSTMASGETKNIQYTYTPSATETEVKNVGFTVTAQAAMDNEAGNLPLRASVSSFDTRLYDAGEAKDEKTFSEIGLYAQLKVNHQGILANGTNQFVYTLTLKNTNAETDLVTKKDINITTALTGWTESSDTFVAGTVSEQIIPAGETVVLTKTVKPISTDLGTNVSKSYEESVTLAGTLTETAVTYTYKSDMTDEDDFRPGSQAETGGYAIVGGNKLYAGGLVGTAAGRITACKQAININGTAVDGQFGLGGVIGKNESASNVSDIYLLGKVNGNTTYAGDGTVAPDTVASDENAALSLAQGTNSNSAWTTYKMYVSGENGTISEKEYGDLSWLVKTESASDFTYSAPSGDQITAQLKSDKKLTSGMLSYTIAYNARKSMNETSENNVYLSGSDGKMDLGKSGFYQILNAYATDGYYHYCTESVALSSAPMVYPYVTGSEQVPEISTQTVERTNDPMTDMINIKLNNANNGTIYYDLLQAGSVPNTADGSTTEQKTADEGGSVKILFATETAQYQLVPVVGGRIYPALTTSVFTQANRDPIPKPTVKCYNFYNDTGNKNDYTAFSAGATYQAGSDMIITPSSDTGYEESYSFRYKFTTDAPTEGSWNDGRYTGTETDPAFMNEAVEYTDSAVIPKSLIGEQGNSVQAYLYVKVSKKNYASQIYYYGPFTVTPKDTLTASIGDRTAADADYTVVNGDVVTLSGAPNGAKIQIMISDIPVTSYNWTDYPSAGITMTKDAGGYVYARIKYNDSKFSEVMLFDFTFGGNCADPRVTPNTGVSSGGEVAAATIPSEATVTLSSRTPNANIFYLKSDTPVTFSIERALTVPEGVTDGAVSGGYKYFTVGSRWYRTAFTEAERYSQAITLTHDKKEAQLVYLSAVALADGYEQSSVLEYIYKVQPMQQVSKPEAAFETRYLPGGESVETASITKGATISFLSVTPGAKLYYSIGSGTETPATEMDDVGIQVDGDYGKNFVVRVKAKKQGMLDSDIITFVYTISEQEAANAPVATPGTTANAPTTVIPGNKILLSTTTKGASIFYTTDGSSPQITENENRTFSAGNETTLEYNSNAGIIMPTEGSGYFSITAVAVKSGLSQSPESHFTYAYPETVLNPYANLDSGNVTLNSVVLLKNLTENAVIYYTVAYGEQVPEDPTFSSSVFSEEYPFTITQKTTIKAMAAKDGVKSRVVTFTYDPMARLEAPKASIASGSIVSRGSVLELKASQGSTVYYTMDGSDPADPSNKAVMSGNTLTMNGEAGAQITIRAYAKAEGKSPSEVVTFTYQFSQNAGGVTASIESGSLVSNGTKVNLMSDVTDAEIYYTTDGSSPTENSRKGTTVEIDGVPGSSFTIKAVAVVNGEKGIVTTFIYRIKEKPAAPTASPAGGVLTIATRVSLNAGEASIYYTTDGTDPTKSSTPYTESILIDRAMTLKAIAVSADGEVSEIGEYTYTAAAKAAKVTSTAKDGSTLNPGDTIRLETATDEADIYYSTDGTVPTLDNLSSLLVYDGENLEIHRSVTIQAVAYREDLRLSDVSSWNYSVEIIPAVEQKEAAAKKQAEEGLQDTDASALSRNTQDQVLTLTQKVSEKKENSPLAIEEAKKIYGEDHTILETYEIKAKEGMGTIQSMEISIPIPEGYEDAVLTVARVEDGHHLTSLETRREGGMLYAKTQELGSFVIVGSQRPETAKSRQSYLPILEAAAGMALLGGVGYFGAIRIKKYRKKKKDYPNE